MSEPSPTAAETTPAGGTFSFDAEVRQLLDLVIHSLYSDRDIFLRELISNASDALDRARVEGLARPELRAGEGEPGVSITVDADAGTLTLSDNGVGLTAEQAKKALGTIAHSGTKAFAELLKAQGRGGEHNLIGQFGVGFYSALMVADRVEVRSLSAEPDAEAIVWSCDGSTTFQITPGERATRGTDIVLYLREDSKEYLDADRIRGVVQKHSRYVGYPIKLGEEQLNEPQVLWTKNPAEVTEEEHKRFYKQVSGDWADPAVTLHVRADAPIQYSALLYIPERAPHDLNHVNGRRPLKLYARKVLILDEARELLPDWLRFVRGVADCEDLQLNVSREMVQKTPVVEKLRKALTSRLIKRLETFAKDDNDGYLRFWKEFGPTLKEGVHHDSDNREKLVKLCRFNTTRHDDGEGLVSLEELIAAMPEGQDTIWYLTGPDRETCARSPHLEQLRKKNVEVILLTDAIDEWFVQSVTEHQGKTWKSAARGAQEADEAEDAPKPTLDAGLTGWLNGLFAGSVKEVRASSRLTESPSVLVDDDWGLGANMERILRGVQKDLPTSRRILEINPDHPMVKALGRLQEEGRAEEAAPLAHLLLDQARLVEGDVSDPAGLVQRLRALSELAAKGLGV
ncbi:molecular chaperone HtpG [Myxococcota bacterium]|nr:molecular chaperone HtpG [Myxococcota bacterium]